MKRGKRLWVLDHFKKHGYGVEIGVWRGAWSHNILNHCHPKQLYLVDPWRYNPDLPQALYGSEQMDQTKMNEVFFGVKNRFHNRTNVVIVRFPSDWVAKNLPPNAVDFCYVDGDHRYEAVQQDLRTCFLKTKPGGIIAGDDYADGGWWGDGVIRAVDEFVNEYDVEIVDIKNRQYVLRKKS